MSNNNYSSIAMDSNKNISMDIITVFRDILKNWWCILLISISISLFSYIFMSEQYTKTYTVNATYIVSVKDAVVASQNLKAASETANQFTQIISSSVMKKAVMEDLGINYFDGKVKATIVESTNLLNLSVTSSTPRMAFKILDSIMNNYTGISQYIVGNYIMEVLQEPTIPLEPDVLFNPYPTMIKVFFICIAVLCVINGLFSYFKDTIRSTEDVEYKLDGRLLGFVNHEKKYKTLISMLKKKRSNLLITNPISSFVYTENLRKVQNRIKNRMDRNNSKVLLVTSVLENEGKSIVSANIALALAEESQKVLLIDCDFRKPSLYKIFGKEADKVFNLGDVLTGSAKNGDLMEKNSNNDLYVIYNTVAYQNSTELITNGKLEELFEYLREKMDYIIIDTSPMGMVADAEEITSFADASLIVVKQHSAEAKYINDKIAILNDSKAAFMGCILNNVYGSVLSIFNANKSSYYEYNKRYGRSDDE